MEIYRQNARVDRAEALRRVSFCLSQIERAGGFSSDLRWTSEIAPRLTLEEIVGALIGAEEHLTEPDEEVGA